MKSHIKIEIEHDDDGIHCAPCNRYVYDYWDDPICPVFQDEEKKAMLLAHDGNGLVRCQACIDATVGGQHDPSL